MSFAFQDTPKLVMFVNDNFSVIGIEESFKCDMEINEPFKYDMEIINEPFKCCMEINAFNDDREPIIYVHGNDPVVFLIKVNINHENDKDVDVRFKMLAIKDN